MPALVIGLDPHKASNTIAVLDAEETLVARRRFENTADGLVACWRRCLVGVIGSGRGGGERDRSECRPTAGGCG
jgi:hypothetical protein